MFIKGKVYLHFLNFKYGDRKLIMLEWVKFSLVKLFRMHSKGRLSN